jgi:hypothetical protein
MCSTAQGLLDRLSDDLSQLGQTAAVERGAAGAGDRISVLLDARAKVEALLLDEVAAFDAAGAYVEAGTPTAARGCVCRAGSLVARPLGPSTRRVSCET